MAARTPPTAVTWLMRTSLPATWRFYHETTGCNALAWTWQQCAQALLADNLTAIAGASG